MQPKAPIGIFDSGLGGLTIVKALQQLLPDESLIYFGDTAHLPYGDKSGELVQGYVSAITQFLVDQGVKAVVIACNTASAVAREQAVEAAGEVPVFDVIGPAVQNALLATQRKRVGIIGTKTTIASGVYRRLIRAKDAEVRVLEKATPMLVPLIEEGWFDNSISREVVEAYMSDTGFLDIDTLILGCTHYPLIKNMMQRYFMNNFAHSVDIIDSSLTVAEFVKKDLGQKNLLMEQHSTASYQYLVSDYNPNFAASAELFLGRKVELEKVEL